MAVMAAQSQVVTLKFVGADRTGQDYVRLHHVSVYDHDQLWHQVIYYPDTTLALFQNGTVGIVGANNHSPLQLAQNTPNPFTGTTDVNLTTADAGDVTLEIVDGNGKTVGTHRVRPEIGTHQFRISLNAAGTYVMTARQNGKTSSIKMVCNGGGGDNSITHVGSISSDGTITLYLKNGMSDGSYPFRLNDRMEFIGYAMIDDTERVSETVTCNQGYYDSDHSLKFDVARPEVATLESTGVTATNAIWHGSVIADNNALVTERGFCWKTSNGMPTLADHHVAVGDGLGAFAVGANDYSPLQPATTYCVRAYAINAVGVSYGTSRFFTTNDTLPEVTTTQPTNVASTAFTCGGTVVAMNSATLTARGVCWNTTGNPTVADSHTTDGTAAGSFTSSVTGLECGTTYYVRAYATNSTGTGYGEEYEVATLAPTVPDVATLSATLYNGLNIIVVSEVSVENCEPISSRGICYSTSPNPTISDLLTAHAMGLGVLNDTVTGLNTGTTYYVRAYATNSLGTAYGEELSVTTPTLPVITTSTVTNVTSSTATCGGGVTADGGAIVTVRGVCWSTSPNPTISDNYTIDGSGVGSFNSNMTFLTPSTIYYVRAYATNSVGTAYGLEVSFITPLPVDGDPCPGTPAITDIESNTYNTVLIGSQCWMKENLRTTKYADNTPIAQGSSASDTTAYWYYPSGSANYKPTFGLLYNWKAVMRDASSSSTNPSGVQGICPIGWHVPSDAEWTQLTDYVSSQSQYVCGSNNTYIAKALAYTGWWYGGTGTCYVGNTLDNNNATGFSALPTGSYNAGIPNDGYYFFQRFSPFWSSTEYNNSNAWSRSLHYNDAGVRCGYSSKYYGFSVRCVRDEGGGSSVTVPTVTTTSVTNITATTATSGGNVTSDGGATVTARGVCWSTSHNPTASNSHTTNGSGTGSFPISITGLTSGTTYYVRAYATNSVGTAYGSEVNFTTSGGGTSQEGQPCPGTPTLTDLDDNIYNTVQIGQQCWMKENIRTTKYADNTPIAQGSETSTTTAYWYFPNDDASNKDIYGLLYNWKAVMGSSSSSSANPSGVQGICPTGWHVPSDAEWKQMEMAVGMSQSDADDTGWRGDIAARLCGNTGWTSSSNANAAGNTSAAGRNSSGFSALPAGYYHGSYIGFGLNAFFWSATEYSSTSAYYRSLNYNFAGVYRYNHNSKSNGYSVRCVKDEN